MLFAFALLLSPGSLLTGPAGARELRIATWNVLAGTVENLDQRADELAQAGRVIAPDILIVQEISGLAAANRLAELLSLGPVHIAISDFSADEGEWFSTFEIAVISKLPIRAVQSFASQLRSSSPTYPPLIRLPDGRREYGEAKAMIVPEIAGLEPMGHEPRGFLRVEIAAAQPGHVSVPLVVYGVHLKSNGVSFCRNLQEDLTAAYRLSRSIKAFPGGLQLERELALSLARIRSVRTDVNEAATAEIAGGHFAIARQRERIAAAIGSLVARDVADNKSISLVAGDFNTALSEPCVTGTDLSRDVALALPCRRERITLSCAGEDGYDDTHALLRDGLAGGAKMRALTATMGRSFVAREGFADSPIDNIYVAGVGGDNFSSAQRLGEEKKQRSWNRSKAAFETRARVFGSDHYPVVTILSLP